MNSSKDTRSQVPPPRSDTLPVRRLLMVVGSAMTTFALAVWVSHAVAGAWERDSGPVQALPSGISRSEVGIVNRQPFLLEERALHQRETEAARLQSFGWADAARTRIHVPLELATEQLLAREGKSP